MSNIFVGNMSFQTSEEDLRALFQPFGEITRVNIPTDRDTGRARGFAFVEMASASEANAAIAALNWMDANYGSTRLNRRPSAAVAVAAVVVVAAVVQVEVAGDRAGKTSGRSVE